MYLYKITNNITNSIYIGITNKSVIKRFQSHKCAAKRGNYSILYNAIRKYGFENFSIITLNIYNNRKNLERAERNAIKSFKKSGYKLYNILEGGSSYFPIVDKEDWKNKLKLKRIGRTPSLGMKHSEDNKKLFSKVSIKYWDSQDTYNKENIIKYGFTEATKLFGISKTHYYRIRKIWLENNEL
jgi:group I intron endonuclease